MENAKDMLTRRAATRLILGGPLAVGLARPVPAGPAHWAVRLEQRLKEMPLEVQPSGLALVRSSEVLGGNRAVLQAVVRLTWPPGIHQRGFRAEAYDLELALALLTLEIREYFLFATAG